MKPTPPQPGWIERVYRVGVGLAIPLTIVAGLALLLTVPNPVPTAPATPRPTTVVMALPLADLRPVVELRPVTPARENHSRCLRNQQDGAPAPSVTADDHCRSVDPR